MSGAIELRALVGQAGRFLAFQLADGSWELPGGVFSEEFEDVDEAMDSILRAAGIACENVAEAFLETAYVASGDTDTVLNLYAPAHWSGEPSAPGGSRAGWFAAEELALVGMHAGTRDAILAALGLQPRANDDAAVLQRLVEARPAAPLAPAAHSVASSDRHAAGLDVLRTLGANIDPEAAFRAMTGRLPEIAGDVVDFALGEVWSHPALDRQTRSLQVVAMLAALGGRGGPLRSHIAGALNHGASPEQVVQTLRMVAVYAGFPAALEAWPVMEEVFKSRGIPRPGAGL